MLNDIFKSPYVMVLAGLKLTFPSEASFFTNLYKSQGLVGRADRLLS
ncbi:MULTISPECIES: hypothetical protein [Kamptonema]|nr:MULTISPECIES: hypothetical protein [Kamptonema]